MYPAPALYTFERVVVFSATIVFGLRITLFAGGSSKTQSSTPLTEQNFSLLPS